MRSLTALKSLANPLSSTPSKESQAASGPTLKRHDTTDDDDLDPDASQNKDSGLTSRLQQLLRDEQNAHAETKSELQVERAAHDETAEKMVELQHRLEVTLQELANLERFVKMQQQITVATGTPQQRERLMREESYLKSRLQYVQSELNGEAPPLKDLSIDKVKPAPTPGPSTPLQTEGAGGIRAEPSVEESELGI